jgi:hypothetical protein
MMFGAISAVKGDVYVSLQYLAFGFGDGPSFPSELTTRALTWLIVQRLPRIEPAGTPRPTPSPAPPSAARQLAERIRAAEYTPDVVDATVELLARSGSGPTRTRRRPSPSCPSRASHRP